MAALTTPELEAIVERLPPDLLRRLVFALASAPTKIIAVNAKRERISIAVRPQSPTDPRLIAMRKRIAEHLEGYETPQLRKQVAKDMGVRKDGWFGKAVASMVRDGTLDEDQDDAISLAKSGRDHVAVSKTQSDKR